MNDADGQWMGRALELAERGRGWVEPNPLVGAVLVRDGRLLGEGWHQRFGGPHAEIEALTVAAADVRGADLFVTLEPCCHHGKTPPCTDAIIRAGIARVVAAMPDPFPEVSGRGIQQLVSAGIRCELGLRETEARRQNAPYLKLLATGRPYVHLKWAMTLDGKIATSKGDSKWISNEAARKRVHALRGRVDAVLVGIGTALADDPELTARPPGPRTARRIVLDSRGRLPRDSRLAQTARDGVILVGTDAIEPARRGELEGLGCEVLLLPAFHGKPAVPALLEELGRRRMTNLLVEGGSEVLGSFLEAGAVDEVHVFIAPVLIGGAAAKTPVGGEGIGRIADALALDEWRVEEIEGNFLLHGRVECFGGPTL